MDLTEIAELPDFKGTFFADIFATLVAGEFIEEQDKVDAKAGEKILGKINSLERAIWTLMIKQGKLCESLYNRLKGDGDHQQVKDNAEKESFSREYYVASKRHKIFHGLFWTMIRERFDPDGKSENNTLGVRAGF